MAELKRHSGGSEIDTDVFLAVALSSLSTIVLEDWARFGLAVSEQCVKDSSSNVEATSAGLIATPEALDCLIGYRCRLLVELLSHLGCGESKVTVADFAKIVSHLKALLSTSTDLAVLDLFIAPAHFSSF